MLDNFLNNLQNLLAKGLNRKNNLHLHQMGFLKNYANIAQLVRKGRVTINKKSSRQLWIRVHKDVCLYQSLHHYTQKAKLSNAQSCSGSFN